MKPDDGWGQQQVKDSYGLGLYCEDIEQTEKRARRYCIMAIVCAVLAIIFAVIAIVLTLL